MKGPEKMTKEKAILQYELQVKEEALDYIKHTFIFNLIGKKIKILVYKNRNNKELIWMLREFANIF